MISQIYRGWKFRKKNLELDIQNSSKDYPYQEIFLLSGFGLNDSCGYGECHGSGQKINRYGKYRFGPNICYVDTSGFGNGNGDGYGYVNFNGED